MKPFIAVVDCGEGFPRTPGLTLLKDILVGFDYLPADVVLFQPTTWERKAARAELAAIGDRAEAIVLFGSRPAALLWRDAPLAHIRGVEKRNSTHRVMATLNVEAVAADPQPRWIDQLERDLAHFVSQ